MSKLRKWIKRLLLWCIVFPIALIFSIYLLLEAAYTIAPEKIDDVTSRAFAKILQVDIFDEQEDDFNRINSLLKSEKYDSVHVVCDSLQGRTKVFEVDLHFYHAVAYINQKQNKMAEYQLRKAIASFSGKKAELTSYAVSVRMLSKLLMEKYDYAEALKVLMPAMETIKEHQTSILLLLPSATSSLYTTMGNCLVALGRYEEGSKHYHLAIDSYRENQLSILLDGEGLDGDTTFFDVKTNAAVQAANAYISQQQYDQASEWFSIAQENYRWLQENVDMSSPKYHHYIFDMSLAEAHLEQHRGETEKALNTFQKCLDDISKQGSEKIRECGQFLLESHHWQEAIDMYQGLDSVAYDHSHLTLDDINQILVPQYNAWRSLGNSPKALMMADSISGAIDSAIVRWRNNDAMELATIYDTQGKEAQIAQKEASLTRLWWIATMVVLALVILSFVIYTVYRRRITTMRAMQERIESELRVARDIQMSMVPSTFPQRDGLDMYAAMAPAKEVGGDLYGYLLVDDKLYFALGDVSGKGVPASLFMAQATRLFLTMAKQGIMPAEICTRMNDALSGEDNENGMFVTFWLGLVDLQTGHLDYCNAGHNPPVIGDSEHGCEFLSMEPNAPIGLFPGLDYEGNQIDDIKGRQLFIYTDGLNEAENVQQEQFGDDRLLDILRNTPFASAQQAVDVIRDEVEAYRNGAEPNDDLTMMCIRLS